jgi:hypothetical protein
MKICPQCAFVNDERFAICAYCNASLADVPVTPSDDPNAPEHQRRKMDAERHQRTRGQLRFAVLCYVLVITASAAFTGFIFNPGVLALYAASALVVAIAVVRDWAGQFTASFLQCACTVPLVYYFGPVHPLTFFMFALHIMIPILFWHWVELIHGANH